MQEVTELSIEPDFSNEDSLSDLERRAGRCSQMKSLWDLELMNVVAEVERREFYLRDGYNSTGDWLSNYLGIGYKRAEEYAGVAVALQELPLLARAYREGKLSYDHLRALVQVACPETERDLLEVTAGASVSQTWRLVNKMLEVSAEDSLDSRGERWCQMRWDHQRRLLLFFAQLPEEQGARLEKLIDAIARKMPDDPLFEHGTPMGVKRADALSELASENAAQGGPSATVVVHVDPETLANGKGNAEIEGGPMVSAETGRMVACDAVIQAVFHDEEGYPMGVGRTTRTVPARMKWELMRRDGGCAAPGCRRKKALNAHHIKHWADGGETEMDNLVLLCDEHHFMVHPGGGKISGVPPKISIERPNLPPIKVGPPDFTEDTSAMFEWEAAVVLGTRRIPDY